MSTSMHRLPLTRQAPGATPSASLARLSAILATPHGGPAIRQIAKSAPTPAAVGTISGIRPLRLAAEKCIGAGRKSAGRGKALEAARNAADMAAWSLARLILAGKVTEQHEADYDLAVAAAGACERAGDVLAREGEGAAAGAWRDLADKVRSEVVARLGRALP